MKDLDFNMKLMCTYGTVNVDPMQKDTRRHHKDGSNKGQATFFKYPIPFANHFKYRHSVDDHNNLRQQCPSIEKTWETKRWAVRIFQFILAITEVNCYKAFIFFIWKDQDKPKPRYTLHQFRRMLALELINYDRSGGGISSSSTSGTVSSLSSFSTMSGDDVTLSLGLTNQRRGRSFMKSAQESEHPHILKTAPAHASSYQKGKWLLNSKAQYQQFHCKMKTCSKQTRTYCRCNPMFWMCNNCHPKHVSYQAVVDHLKAQELCS